jgi:hypothetical protein
MKNEKDILKEIKILQNVFPATRENLTRSKHIIVASIKDKEKVTEGAALHQFSDLMDTICNIEKQLKDLSDILSINDKIKQHLFKPIKTSQWISIWTTVLFGLVGLLLAGPQLTKYFDRTEDITPPSYYTTLILQNVRQDIGDGLLTDAQANIDEILRTNQDSKSKAQAMLYKSFIGLLMDSDSYENILRDISSVEGEGDNFINGQKILMTSIYHYKTDNYEESQRFLREIDNNNIYDRFGFESLYYQYLITLAQSSQYEKTMAGVKESLSKLREAKIKLYRLKEYEFSSEVMDMTSGKVYNRQGIIDVGSILYDQKIKEIEKTKSKLEDAILIKKYEKEMNNIKIAIRYNTLKLGNKTGANPEVLLRAEKFRDNIRKNYPKMKVSFGPINESDIEAGGYKYDNLYWKNDKSRLFVEKKLIGELRLNRLKFYVREKLLAKRYPEYDLVFVISNP